MSSGVFTSRNRVGVPRERNHLTTCLDLHKDHLGPGESVARLDLGGELKVEIGLGPRGGLLCKSFIDEAQSHHGRVGIVQGLGGYQDGQAVKGFRLMSRPPSEGPVAESANRAYWPGRPF